MTSRSAVEATPNRQSSILPEWLVDQRVLLSIAVLAVLPWVLPSKALAVNVLIYGCLLYTSPSPRD